MSNAVIKPTKGTYSEAIKLAWPAILESFFMALAGLIDSYMVSSLGSAAVAAVGLTTQPKFVGLAAFFAISISVSALVARRKGEDRIESAHKVLSTAVILTAIIAVVLSFVFVWFAPQIMTLCGSTAETHDMAVNYYRIIMAGIGFNGIQLTVNSAQRGVGNTKISMTTNLTSSAVNVAFNYLLIGGHLGFPAMGIRGAAIATVFGTFVAAVMSLMSTLRKDSFLQMKKIIRERLFFGLEELGAIAHLGYSIFFEQLLMRVGFMLTALMAARQGDYAMAAHQVGMNIMGLSFSFGDGLQAAAVALIGFNLGRREPEKAKMYGRVCQRIGLCIAAFLAIVYFFGARFLMSMFFEEPEIVQLGIGIMRMIIIICLFQIVQVIYMGCLRGAGDTLYTAIASTISVTIVRTVGSFVFGYMLGFGIVGIWVGVLADQFSRFLFGYLRFKKGKWVKIKI